jgi:hypothetical protein
VTHSQTCSQTGIIWGALKCVNGPTHSLKSFSLFGLDLVISSLDVSYGDCKEHHCPAFLAWATLEQPRRMMVQMCGAYVGNTQGGYNLSCYCTQSFVNQKVSVCLDCMRLVLKWRFWVSAPRVGPEILRFQRTLGWCWFCKLVDHTQLVYSFLLCVAPSCYSLRVLAAASQLNSLICTVIAQRRLLSTQLPGQPPYL